MPQRDSEGKEDRSKEDKADFDKMLASIGDLYLSMRVLILLDNSYMGRYIRLERSSLRHAVLAAT